ncbi:hypothetical protein EIP91_006266 [Steccherinum ochraceum]|uniref:RING-type domain-containing protein n=1 Tax=Steccherinum ochraceum TaxID=92696 RepID=A0A4R0R675_9APHY|nr:hypothetical protein EIP91_006266 [Steccherinum ochraceum]
MPPSAPRSRRPVTVDNDDDDPGMASDGSMPSLQTVSDSSDDDFSDDDEEDSDEFVSDEDDADEEVDEDMPRLVPASEDAPRRQSRAHDPALHQPAPRATRSEGVQANEDATTHTYPLPSGVRGATIPAWPPMDRRAPHMNTFSDYVNTDPVLRNILGAMQGPLGALQGAQLLYAFGQVAGPPPPDKDPQRAETIIAALEKVPADLITRYEKLRAGNGEHDCDGCPICRESLLEEPPVMEEEDLPSVAFFAELPYFSEEERFILAFPCPGKHIFHNTCLSPWLARKTTCPSCRFDVDPDSLTLRLETLHPQHPAARPSRQRSEAPRRKWAPPKVPSFPEWLEEEEARAADPTRRPAPPPPSAPSVAGPSSPSRAQASPTWRMQEVPDEDDEGAWTTDEDDEDDEEDEEEDEDEEDEDEEDEDDDVERQFAVMPQYQRELGFPPFPFAEPPAEGGYTVGVGNMDNPAYREERRRFLRSLMDPNNPLQLFLGDGEGDVPTLIPVRERRRGAGRDDDDDDDGPPPLMDNDFAMRTRLFMPPGPPAGVRPRPQPEGDVDDLPPLVPEVPSDEEDSEDDDDIPPLVGESDQTPPVQVPTGAAAHLPPWLDPRSNHNPAASFEMLNELADIVLGNTIEDVD